MPSTASGIVYPASTDDVDVPGDLGALAASVEAIVAALLNPPTGYIKATATQSLTTGVITALAMDTTIIDTDGMADLANGQLVVRHAGTYLISGSIAFTANATGNRATYLYAGPSAGPQIVGSVTTATLGTATATIVAASALARLSVGDVIQVRGWQTSGGALNSANSNGNPYVSAYRVGP